MFEPSRSTTPLAIFNRQVLQCQDDAYTLALYLLGDEAMAEAAVQAAVESVFRHGCAGDKPFRLSILQAVANESHQHLQRALPIIRNTGEQSILEMLRRLPEQERQALILVDVLRLNYEESAEVMRVPSKNFGLRLAWARRRLAACQVQPVPPWFMQNHGKI
jgi:DNA-directed RNA polymerase specialized sigma24 family protein